MTMCARQCASPRGPGAGRVRPPGLRRGVPAPGAGAAAIQETVEEAGIATAVISGTLLRDDGGVRRVLLSRRIYVHGGEVDWGGVLQAGGRR